MSDGDGYTPAEGDRDDADREVHPGADEVWYGGVDQDCDGSSDFDQDSASYDSWRLEGGTDVWVGVLGAVAAVAGAGRVTTAAAVEGPQPGHRE